jgi:hypothetical protein
MKIAALLAPFLGAMIAQSVAQQTAKPPPRFLTAKVTTDQIDKYRAEVEAIPDIHCHDIWAHQRECSSKARFTIWTFTLSGHPAHPAVSRGILLVEQTGRGSLLGIDRSGHYAGERGAFEAWMKELQVLDQKEVAQWQAILKPK